MYIRYLHPLWRSWSIVYCKWRWPHMTLYISCLFMASTLMYPVLLYVFAVTCRYVSLYCTDEWLVLPPGSSLLHLWDGFYNVFRPSCYPSDLTHYGAYVIVDFTTPGRSHFYGLPCLYADSLDPMDLYYPLIFQDHPLKPPFYCCTWLLTSYSRVHMTFDLKPAYIGMCA